MSKNGSRHLAAAAATALTNAPVAPKAEVTDVAQPETFNFDEADRLRWALAEERVRSANMAISIAQQTAQAATQQFTELQKAFSQKYSENGKYTFVGSVDIATGAGQRKLATAAD